MCNAIVFVIRTKGNDGNQFRVGTCTNLESLYKKDTDLHGTRLGDLYLALLFPRRYTLNEELAIGIAKAMIEKNKSDQRYIRTVAIDREFPINLTQEMAGYRIHRWYQYLRSQMNKITQEEVTC